MSKFQNNRLPRWPPHATKGIKRPRRRLKCRAKPLRLEGGNYFIINHDSCGRAPDEVERGQRQHPSVEGQGQVYF